MAPGISTVCMVMNGLAVVCFHALTAGSSVQTAAVSLPVGSVCNRGPVTGASFLFPMKYI